MSEAKRQAAAERKRKSRAKQAAHAARLDMTEVRIQLAGGERAMIARNAAARDFEDQDEYLMRLVRADAVLLKAERDRHAAATNNQEENPQ